MEVCVSRVLLVAATVVLVVSALVLWCPWVAKRSVDLEYVRGKFREIAEILERGAPASLVIDAPLKLVEDYDAVKLVIAKPKEEPVVVVLKVPAIVYEDKSLSLPLRVERRGFVEIVENGTRIVLKPLPRVSSTTVLEYGRRVHLVAVKLVKITSEKKVIQGKVLITFEELEPYTYLRSYDYSGVSRVLVGGDEVARVEVSEGEGLRVTVATTVAKVGSSD